MFVSLFRQIISGKLLKDLFMKGFMAIIAMEIPRALLIIPGSIQLSNKLNVCHV
jgi:hypothetical protein